MALYKQQSYSCLGMNSKNQLLSPEMLLTAQLVSSSLQAESIPGGHIPSPEACAMGLLHACLLHPACTSAAVSLLSKTPVPPGPCRLLAAWS